jgi:hypothetical protein
MEPIYKISIFLDKRDLGILEPDRTYGKQNSSDWYVPVVLTVSDRLVDEYIHTYMDPFKTSMTRQLINPYFVEFGFFETIQSYSASTDGAVLHNINTKAPIYNITINS